MENYQIKEENNKYVELKSNNKKKTMGVNTEQNVTKPLANIQTELSSKSDQQHLQENVDKNVSWVFDVEDKIENEQYLENYQKREVKNKYVGAKSKHKKKTNGVNTEQNVKKPIYNIQTELSIKSDQQHLQENVDKNKQCEETIIVHKTQSKIAKLQSKGKKQAKNVNLSGVEPLNGSTYLSTQEQNFIKKILSESVETISSFLVNSEPSKCTFCDFTTTNASLTIQMRKHRLKNHNECQLCSKRLSSSSEMRFHFKENHRRNSNFFICGIEECLYKEKQENLRSLYIHIRTQHCNFLYTCQVCSSKFSSRITLQQHISGLHRIGAKTYEVPCKLCKFVTFGEKNLNGHISRIHSTRKVMACSLCEYKTKVTRYLSWHIKLHSKNHLKCDQCVYITKRSERLADHKNKKHRNRDFLICSVCNYKTQHRGRFNLHEFIHADKELICDKCDFKTKTEQSLKIHKMYHEDPTFFCDACEYKTCNAGNFSTHKKVKHGTEKHECDQCGKLFNYKRHLERHQAKHAGLKMPCSFCEKHFYRKDKIKEHLRIVHIVSKEESMLLTSELPESSIEPNIPMIFKAEDVQRNFACLECPKMFTNSKHLSRHKNSVHSGVILSCQYCQKTFSRNDKLNVHLNFICKNRSSV